MLWALWAAAVVVCVGLGQWQSRSRRLWLFLVTLASCMIVGFVWWPELVKRTLGGLYRGVGELALLLRLDSLVVNHANMIVTSIAGVWLLYRGWQTLWKPVPELISILGFEVPDPPDVSLTTIRVNAATIHWTQARPNQLVHKFLIQVNGVKVGESHYHETAITVTGLKPNHFYNVRVIAVGYNNFQARSRVIRLRTYDENGKPELGNGRLPSDFTPDDQENPLPSDVNNEDGTRNGNKSSPLVGIETNSCSDISLSREPSVSSTSGPTSSGPVASGSSGSGPRRNPPAPARRSTLSAAADDDMPDDISSHDPDESLEQLGEKFNKIRNEMEEIKNQIEKDEAEYEKLVNQLTEEKEVKKRTLKEKEETTEKLKKEANATDRAMRSAQQRRVQAQKKLTEKQQEHNRLRNEMGKWDREIQHMHKKRGVFVQDRARLQQETDAQLNERRVEVQRLQAAVAQDEAELSRSGIELKEAENQKKMLLEGEGSEEWRESDRQTRRATEARIQGLQRQLMAINRRGKTLDDYENLLQSQVTAAHQDGYVLPNLNQISSNHVNATGLDFDQPMQGVTQIPQITQSQLKRRSRNGASISSGILASPGTYAGPETSAYASATSTGASRQTTMPPPGFGSAAPFIDLSELQSPHDDMTIATLNSGAPLSPTAAASRIPTGLLDDDHEEDTPSSPAPVLLSRHNTIGSLRSPTVNVPQSPASSGRSRSISMSSPHSSTQNLPFLAYPGDSMAPTSSPRAVDPQASTKSTGTFASWLQRAPKPTNETPSLGSLALSQSRSSPRQTAETDEFHNKRRTSISSGFGMFDRNSAGSDLAGVSLGTGRSVAPNRQTLLPAGKRESMLFSDSDQNHARSGSLTSPDFPRASTESGSSIWVASPPPNKLWPPESGDNKWASRNVSRRPSIHGSPFKLKTTLAEPDDEILDDSLNPPPQSVGVIGTKPPTRGASKPGHVQLNPTAPTFMIASVQGLFRASKEHREARSKDRSRSKSKVRGSAKDRERNLSRDSLGGGGGGSEAGGDSHSVDDSSSYSPTRTRKSARAPSISADSMTRVRDREEAGLLSLERASSNTPSDATSGAGVGSKDQESGLRKLLRKGSSSKFGLSSFSIKKRAGAGGKDKDGAEGEGDEELESTTGTAA